MPYANPFAPHRAPTFRPAGSAGRAAPLASAQQALRRAAARSPALRPADVLQLQRTIGNRAVGALLSVGAPSIQRGKRWEKEADAIEWVKSNPVDKLKHTTAPKYFNFLKSILKKTVDEEDLGWVEAAANAFWLTSREERKTLSSSGWQHIWRGDVGSKGYPTGFHWKGKADEAISEGDGTVTKTNDAGFYHEGVQYKDDIAKNGTEGASYAKMVKPEGSTFFPDTWTEQNVKDAVELRNSQDQITKPLAGAGVQLVKSGETIYPSI